MPTSPLTLYPGAKLRDWLTNPVEEFPPKSSSKLKQWLMRGMLEVVKARAEVVLV